MKNIKYIIIGAIVAIIAFSAYYKSSYCAQASLIGQALLNSYGIASEYYCARAGRNIVNADETSTDITGISGINNGTVSQDYSKIISDNANLTIDYITSHIRDVDISELSLEEQAKLASIVAANNNVPYAYKAFTLGGITLYYAVNDLGEWIGNSYDNIVAKFDSMSQIKLDAVNNTLSVDYPISSDYLYGSDFKFINGNNIYYEMHFTNDVFVACGSGTDAGRVYVLSPTASISALGKWYVNGQLHDITDAYISNQFAPTGTITSDNLDFYYGALEFQFDYGSHNYVYTTNTFGNINDLISNFNTSYLNDAYSTEFVDSSGVPYVVPDIDGYGATIGDIYSVLDTLRDAVLTFPDAGSIAAGLTDTLTDTISDLIDAIKELAISVPIVEEQDIITQPIDFTGTTIPAEFPTDIFDPITDALSANFGIFSFFEPLFYIFGTFNGIFALWTFVPMLIIILLIVWALK